jgi:hypothetical protein
MSRCAAFAWVSEITRSLPHRSQVIRMNHDGKALNGSRCPLSRGHADGRSRRTLTNQAARLKAYCRAARRVSLFNLGIPPKSRPVASNF